MSWRRWEGAYAMGRMEKEEMQGTKGNLGQGLTFTPVASFQTQTKSGDKLVTIRTLVNRRLMTAGWSLEGKWLKLRQGGRTEARRLCLNTGAKEPSLEGSCSAKYLFTQPISLGLLMRTERAGKNLELHADLPARLQGYERSGWGAGVSL